MGARDGKRVEGGGREEMGRTKRLFERPRRDKDDDNDDDDEINYDDVNDDQIGDDYYGKHDDSTDSGADTTAASSTAAANKQTNCESTHFIGRVGPSVCLPHLFSPHVVLTRYFSGVFLSPRSLPRAVCYVSLNFFCREQPQEFRRRR